MNLPQAPISTNGLAAPLASAREVPGRTGPKQAGPSRVLALVALAAGLALVVPAPAQAGTGCQTRWGSLAKAAGGLSTAPVTGVRAGQHGCFDRLVVDVTGRGAGFRVQYVDAVLSQGRGAVLPLRGGARIAVVVLDPTSDPATGAARFTTANPAEVVDVAGWRTFRQVSAGGSFEGLTTLGLGVRARLPFRAFTLAGPGGRSRLVIDVAHHW